MTKQEELKTLAAQNIKNVVEFELQAKGINDEVLAEHLYHNIRVDVELMLDKATLAERKRCAEVAEQMDTLVAKAIEEDA